MYKYNFFVALHILLRRLAYPNRLSDLEDIFRRPPSELSAIINSMLNMLYDKFQHLLTNIDHPWIDLDGFSLAIHQQGAPLMNCVGFVDGIVYCKNLGRKIK